MMKLKMISHWLLKHWKTIKFAYIYKHGKKHRIIATRETLNNLYKYNVIDDWHEINNLFKGD